jgi:hypothetical protein
VVLVAEVQVLGTHAKSRADTLLEEEIAREIPRHFELSVIT